MAGEFGFLNGASVAIDAGNPLPVTGTFAGGGNAAASATGAPVPASADFTGFNVGGNLVGVSAANPFPITITNASVAVTGAFFQTTQPVSLASVGLTGTTAPTSATLVGRVDANGNLQAVSDTNPLQVKIAKATTGTATQVAASASSTTVLASNAGRRSAIIVNDSTATLYLLCHTGGTASSSVYTVALPPKGTVGASFVIDNGYSGDVIGIWSAANGNAVVTEFSA